MILCTSCNSRVALIGSLCPPCSHMQKNKQPNSLSINNGHNDNNKLEVLDPSSRRLTSFYNGRLVASYVMCKDCNAAVGDTDGTGLCIPCQNKANNGGSYKPLKNSPSKKSNPSNPIPISIRIFQCKICDNEYKNASALSKHRRQVHKIGRSLIKFKCTYTGCHTQCVDLTSLNLHISAVHLKEKNHFCRICGHAFGSKQALVHHKKNCNENELSFTCADCGVRFKRQQILNRHCTNLEHMGRVKKQSKPPPGGSSSSRK